MLAQRARDALGERQGLRADRLVREETPQIGGELAGRGEAIVPAPRQRHGAEDLEVARNRGVELAQRLELATLDALEELVGRARIEGPAQREQLVQHDSERIHVRALIDRPVAQRTHLFGAHVVRTALHRVRLRDRRAIGQARQAEVDEHDAPVGGVHQVRGLDVAVDHAVPMCELERVGNRGDELHDGADPAR